MPKLPISALRCCFTSSHVLRALSLPGQQRQRAVFHERRFVEPLTQRCVWRLNETNAYRSASASASSRVMAHHTLSVCGNCSHGPEPSQRTHKPTSTSSSPDGGRRIVKRREKVGRGGVLSCDESGNRGFESVEMNAGGRCSEHRRGVG